VLAHVVAGFPSIPLELVTACAGLIRRLSPFASQSLEIALFTDMTLVGGDYAGLGPVRLSSEKAPRPEAG
jgi:hypothetical protein